MATANIIITAPDWRPLNNTWTGINVFQSNVQITAATAASSTGTGALQISAGGLGVNGAVYVGGSTIIQNTTESTSVATGALQVSGGVGIGANLVVQGNTYKLGTADSTSTNTGTLQVSGGVGIKSNVFIGGNVSIGASVQSPSYTDIIISTIWDTSFNVNAGTNYYMSSGTPGTITSVNFKNLTAIAGYSYNFTFVLPTTNPAYYYNLSTCQVNGGACTFKSNISTLPTPTAFIIQTFTCMYLAGTWYVITSALTF
jgi:hypothetical protein